MNYKTIRVLSEAIELATAVVAERDALEAEVKRLKACLFQAQNAAIDLADRAAPAQPVPAAEQMPVAFMESPHGAIRANPAFKWTAPQSVHWSIPLYVSTAASAEWRAEAERLMSLLASAWYYGGWKAETYNEREMQKILESRGWWPIENEAALMAHLDKAAEGKR